MRLFLCLIGILLAQSAVAGMWIDDFEDGSNDAWTVVNTLEDEAVWGTERGVAVGETFDPHRFPTGWVAGDVNWQDYEMTCRIQVLDGSRKLMSVGVMVYVQWRIRTFYVIELIPADQMLYFIKVARDGSGTLSRIEFAEPINADQWYTFKVKILGNGEFEYGIEDEVAIVKDVRPLTQGRIGMTVSAGQAEFDDVTVTGESIQDGGPALRVKSTGSIATMWAEIKG